MPSRVGSTGEKARRGRGEGAVWYDEKNGRWEAAFEAERHPVTGKRRRIKVRARTKNEALKKLDQARENMAAGVEPGAGAMTVDAFLDDWLDTVVAGRVGSERTVANYRDTLKQVRPALGRYRLDKLTPQHVDRVLAAKAAEGLSRSYISRMRSTLADALRHAERRGMVRRNAAELAVMPKTDDRQSTRRSLTEKECRALLKAAAGHRLGALVEVGLRTGLRPGELAGLLWTDVDLDSEQPTLSVTGSLKQKPKKVDRADPEELRVWRGDVKKARSGLRTIALGPAAVEALRRHREAQDAERAEALAWRDEGYVFTSTRGTPLDPSNLRKAFAEMAATAKITDAYPYLMRHTVTSQLIDAGHSIEAVADMLGDDPRTLYRHYRHRTRPVATAGLAMDDLLTGGPALDQRAEKSRK